MPGGLVRRRGGDHQRATDQAARAGAHLVAAFRPTDRNRMVEIAYRFAGFGDESCDCLGVLPETDVDGPRRLHLAADRREPQATIDLTAPDLTAERMAPADGRAAADVRAASAPA